MADVKTVRLRSTAGVVVETTEENAARLATGFTREDREKPTSTTSTRRRATAKAADEQ